MRKPLPFGITEVSPNWFVLRLTRGVFFGKSRREVLKKERIHRQKKLSANSAAAQAIAGGTPT